VLIAASFGIYLAPLRNSAAAVVGMLLFSLVLQLVAILPGVGHIKPDVAGG
jgi:hypothetical protein